MLRNWALALRPTLSLDFLAGLNDSRITYSGGANGTRVNSSGLIVAATTPRFDYDPVTLAAKGLLVEEARTNLLSRSAEFDNAYWTPSTVTITANTTTAPDGTLTADTFTPTGVDGVVFTSYSASAQQYTVTAYGKGSGSLALFNTTAGFTAGSSCAFNLATGVASAVTNYGATTGSTATIVNAGGGWYRCSLTVLATATTYFISLGCASSTANVIWGAQLEAGSFPTSYIPTTSAAVTRTADSAVMTGTNFSSWYNQSEGTFVFQYANAPTDTPRPVVIVRRSGDVNYRLQMDTLFSYAIDAGAITSATGTGAVKAGAKIGSSFKTDNFATSTNGGALSTNTSGANPNAIDQMTIGYFDFGSASRLNGHIQSIAFYPRAMPGQLQALTS